MGLRFIAFYYRLGRTFHFFSDLMLVEIFSILLLILFGVLVFKLTDSYCLRVLGFDSMNHDPMFIPGNSTSKSPLVCVLGWGGSTRRQLRRLLDFYSSTGIPTISWISPMTSFFFGIDEKQVERVLDLLLLQNERTTGIFIHLHSNNGVFVWGNMIKLMQQNDKYATLLPNVKGVILDSAPFVNTSPAARWIIISAFGASRPCVSIILNRPQYVHWFWTPLIIVYLSIKFFNQRYFSANVSGNPDRIRIFVNSIPKNITQYYLYSDADRLIPHKVIGSCSLL